MADALIAILIIMILASGWIFVQHLSRQFAQRHPEFGPAREEGGGCGTSCQCSGGHCSKKEPDTNQQSKQSIKLSLTNPEDRLL